MKFCEMVIKPLTPFGTPLKGDTIFGHVCWQIFYDSSLIKGSFERWLEVYGHEPFAVFSSAYPGIEGPEGRSWFLPRPALPLHYFFSDSGGDCFEVLKKRKALKARRWIKVCEPQINLSGIKPLNEKEVAREILKAGDFGVESEPEGWVQTVLQPHNAINRLSFTTGEGFAPYQLETFWYLPGLSLSIFVLYREEAFEEENLVEIFRRIGEMGFGRDASAGLGRFEVKEIRNLSLPSPSETLYTLGPYVPQEDEYLRLWYEPFVRFGRHGGPLAVSGQPFKEPILMADEGAVLRCKEPKGPYVGRPVFGVSKAEKNTLVQGYSLVWPLEGLS